MKKRGKIDWRIIGVLAIVIYWVIYIWQLELSNRGDYQYFSYTFHEIYSIGYILVPLLTIFWLVKVTVDSIKQKKWRQNSIVILILLLLLFGQGGYIYQQSQLVFCTVWTEVADIPDEYHIVIYRDEQLVTLEATPSITRLLQTDGTIYGFYYEINKHYPEQGTLYNIWNSED